MTIIQNWLSILVLIGCVAITRATDGEEATTHPGESMPWLKEDSEKPANFASYIVGGQAAELQLQWVASLQNRIDGEYQHWCGGSLIAKGWILTAAHCIDKFNTVCIGGLKLANNAEFHCVTVKKIYQHEQYDSLSLANDIMLVEFDSDYSGAPVKLTSGDLNEDTDDSAKIVGWGKTESLDVSYELKELSVKVYPNDDCSVWGGGIPEELPQSVMCTETLSDGEGFCTGDSGGPLFAEVEGETLLIGVISFGSTTCVGLPMVYTRVGEYLTWIQETMENSNPDLDDISLPASCADGSCIEVKDSAFGRTETIYNFSLSKGVELQQAFFFQGDLQSDVSFYIEGIEQRLGAINGNPSAFMPLSAGSCFIPGDYRVVIDLGIWRTNKYDQYRLLVPKDLNSLPECNPFPELDPLQTLSAPDICLETPGRCIELEGEFVREWTLFSYQQSDYRRLSIWFQGPTSYDMNLLKGGNVALYKAGLGSEWVTFGSDCCPPGKYDISLEKAATAKFGGKYRIFIDNMSPNCLNDVTTVATSPVVSADALAKLMELFEIAAAIGKIADDSIQQTTGEDADLALPSSTESSTAEDSNPNIDSFDRSTEADQLESNSGAPNLNIDRQAFSILIVAIFLQFALAL